MRMTSVMAIWVVMARNASRRRILIKCPPEKYAGGQTGQFADDLFTEKAIEFVRGNRERPFFLYLAYISPHANRMAGKKDIHAPTTAPYSQEDWPEHEKKLRRHDHADGWQY